MPFSPATRTRTTSTTTRVGEKFHPSSHLSSHPDSRALAKQVNWNNFRVFSRRINSPVHRRTRKFCHRPFSSLSTHGHGLHHWPPLINRYESPRRGPQLALTYQVHFLMSPELDKDACILGFIGALISSVSTSDDSPERRRSVTANAKYWWSP